MPSDLLTGVLPKLLQYLPATLLYWSVPSLLALVFGTVLCIVRVGRHNVLYWFCTIFISFFRGTPGIVQIYLVFFGLPKVFYLFGLDIDDWNPGIFFIIATAMNLSCFVCEALRGGYLGVDRGQIETGLSIGYSRIQNFVYVIVPQTLKVAILNLKNLEIDVLKDTSVAYTIGVMEILGSAKAIISAQYGTGQLWILGLAAVIYFVLCTLVETGFTLASHRMERYEKRFA
ncbi:amino acid ABC transporter permease [Bifidobacterium moukalabense]|uniref:amino acid ABC transporter permease n=1 Tax=Bifidobacterium moukalabense TaxID=1333651 RepID=UPI0010F504D7|nr:amino acid ABC transporter permease [Bifidobacterium moukalabense]